MSDQLTMDSTWNSKATDPSHSRRFPFPWTPDQVERLRAMVAEGKSASDIGAELGCSRSAVLGKMHRLKLKATPKPPGPKPRHSKLHPNRQYKPIRKRKPPMIFDNYQSPTVDIVPLNRTLLELKQGECRYPYGDGTFLFCGHPVVGDLPYCACHALLCYTTSSGERPNYKYHLRKTSGVPAREMAQRVEPVNPDEMGTAA